MKKLLLLALVAISVSVNAQSSIALAFDKTFQPIAPNAILLYTTTPNSILTITLDIKNVSSTTHTYDVKRYDITLNKVNSDNTEAEAYFCFAGSCYGASTMV